MARLALRAPDAAEDDLHAQVARALDVLLLPPTEWSTFPSGGYELSAAARARLFRLGLKTGWPDVLVLHGGRAHGIELKAREGRLSETRIVRTRSGGARIVVGQREMHERLRSAGMPIVVCRSVRSVLDQLHAWGIPTREAKV